MKFFIYEVDELRIIINNCTYQELIRFTKYINDVAPGRINIKKLASTKKVALVNYLIELLSEDKNILNISKKLLSTKLSAYLYTTIVWENRALQTSEISREFDVNFPAITGGSYGVNEEYLNGMLGLIIRATRKSGGYYYTDDLDVLSISRNIISLLKILLPIPDDFDLEGVKNPQDTKYNYTNENEIFNFISVISEMLKNNLVEFGKTGEKPLAKSINILKTSSGVNEFYSEKKLDSFASDMLTRSFSYYYWASKKFQSSELESLKDFVTEKFEDKFYFFITRILASHLKKVRYDHHYSKELGLFNILKTIILDLPEESWVTIENILKYSKYRGLEFHLEYKSKTDNYILDVGDGYYSCESSYSLLFFEPVLKGAFFYLASLGLLEIKYDEPKSDSTIRAKGKEYISVWDGLKYIKLTELGKYIFGLSKKYEQKTIKKITTKLKFDEYKPIITIDSQDTITQAKLEPFTDKYDANRYILSYTKIFRDCKSKKVLDIKIDNFYKQIEPNPPQVFKDFFEQIKLDSNMLKRDLTQVVIKLKNNKKLLNLFLKNKKLQEMIIKAEGYRIIVSKNDIPKLTKIVKDNGFFIEF